MKRLIGLTALLLAIGSVGLTAGPAFSQSSGTVPATVTVASPCVTVPSTAIDYGTQGFASTGTGERTSTGAAFQVTNCGLSQEFISVAGQDMTGGTATWTLGNNSQTTCFQDGGTTLTLNRYKHEVADGTTPYLLTTTNQSLGVLSASASKTLTPKLYMPCSGSDGDGATMITAITFTASY
jgi:hypothetical protein